MLRYTLTYNETSIELTGRNLPADVNELKILISRSNRYGSALRSVKVGDKFHGIGKAFIDDIIDANGWNATITCTIEYIDYSTYTWVNLYDGTLDLSSYKKEKTFSTVNIESGDIQSLIMNKASLELDYNQTTDIDGNLLVTPTNAFQEILLRGQITYDEFGVITSNPESQRYCVYPFKAIEKLIYILTGKEARLRSTILGRTQDGNGADGSMAYRMFTNGHLLRDYPFTSVNLNLSIEKTFDSLSAQGWLGMGFEKYNGRYYAVIERRDYFFNPVVVATIDSINDLEYSIEKDFMYNGIEVGYANFEKRETEFGQAEYNGRSKYTSPIKYFDKDFKIVSPYRMDAMTIEGLRTSIVPSSENETTDKEIFIIDSINDNGTIKSAQLEDFESASGVYNGINVFTNLNTTPARMLLNWGEWLAIAVQHDKDKYLNFQNAEALSKVITQKTGEPTVRECANIPIGDLGEAWLTGYVAKFNCTFSNAQFNAILENPNGMIKFYDYVKNEYVLGWIKEVSMSPIDKIHNCEIWISSNQEYDLYNYLQDANFEPILTADGDYILIL